MYFFVISVPVRAKKIFYKNFCKKGRQKYIPHSFIVKGKIFLNTTRSVVFT